MDKILETINLHGGYGPKIKILHGVDIHVNKKEIVFCLFFFEFLYDQCVVPNESLPMNSF